MIEFWNGLILGQKIFLCIAVPSTMLLIIQIIMMLVGLGGHGDADTGDGADLDGDGVPDTDADGDAGLDSDTPDSGLSVFSFRGIVSMLCIMGWSGFGLLDPGTGLPVWAGIAISAALGILTLIGVAFAMKAISRLQQSGNLDMRNAVGKVGQVYLTVPAGGRAAGKVNLTVQEQLREFPAVTTGNTELKTGAYVRVVAFAENGTLVVEPIANPNEKNG